MKSVNLLLRRSIFFSSTYFTNKYFRLLNYRIHLLFTIIFSSIFLIKFFFRLEESNVGFGTYVPLNTETTNLPELLGLSDNGFYVSTAIDLSDGRPISETSKWALRQWAPGLPVLLSFFIRFAESVPIGLTLAVFQTVLWLTIFISIFFRSLNFYVLLISFIMSIGLIFSAPFSIWFFNQGFFYSESISIAFFVLALLTVFKKNSLITYQSAIYAGFFLALSAYFKGTFEFVGLTLFLFFLLFIFYFNFFKRENNSKTDKISFQKKFFTIILVFFIITTPWRLISDKYLYKENFNISWTQVTSQYWGHRWMPTDWLEEREVFWFIDGRGNSACLLDLEKCKKISESEIAIGGQFDGNGFYSQSDFKNLAIQTYLENPIALISQRIEPFLKFWFSHNVNIFNFLFSAVFFIVIFINIIFILYQRGTFQIFSFFYLSLLLGTLSPLLIQSIEVRYFYPIQVISYLTALLIVQNFIHSRLSVSN